MRLVIKAGLGMKRMCISVKAACSISSETINMWSNVNVTVSKRMFLLNYSDLHSSKIRYLHLGVYFTQNFEDPDQRSQILIDRIKSNMHEYFDDLARHA